MYMDYCILMDMDGLSGSPVKLISIADLYTNITKLHLNYIFILSVLEVMHPPHSM